MDSHKRASNRIRLRFPRSRSRDGKLPHPQKTHSVMTCIGAESFPAAPSHLVALMSEFATTSSASIQLSCLSGGTLIVRPPSCGLFATQIRCYRREIRRRIEWVGKRNIFISTAGKIEGACSIFFGSSDFVSVGWYKTCHPKASKTLKNSKTKRFFTAYLFSKFK